MGWVSTDLLETAAFCQTPPAGRWRRADVARCEGSKEGNPLREDAYSVLRERSLCPDLGHRAGAATSLLTLLPCIFRRRGGVVPHQFGLSRVGSEDDVEVPPRLVLVVVTVARERQQNLETGQRRGAVCRR